MNAGASALAALFPEGDYRFHLTLRRGDPAEFFRPRDPSGAVLAERARWLAEAPARYSALQPEAGLAAEEFARMAAPWSAAPAASGDALAGARGNAAVVEIGRHFEPDVLFLASDSAGQIRLRGGALCFPTGWALEEKLGHPIDFIHRPVPGLNAALAAPIQQFLAKLKPGVAFLRDNWGIAGTDALNLHPAREIPPPSPPVSLQQLWLRVEHQALLALPQTGAIVFGIRIALHRLDTVVADPAAAEGLRRALRTMPADLVAYKRIEGIRTELVKCL